MASSKHSDTEELVDLAAQGNQRAREQLLVRHRDRLRRMVSLRMDRRMAARLDPSDVVQESLADAAERLSDYLRRRPLPFYAWLRQFAWERLIDMHRRHVHAKRRSVVAEEPDVLNLPDESAVELASRLVDLGSSPSRQLLRKELRQRVRDALATLPARDREVLVLRHLEQLPTRDAAAVLGISEGAAKLRHLRALERLRARLGNEMEWE